MNTTHVSINASDIAHDFNLDWHYVARVIMRAVAVAQSASTLHITYDLTGLAWQSAIARTREQLETQDRVYNEVEKILGFSLDSLPENL